jgi:caveolin 1
MSSENVQETTRLDNSPAQAAVDMDAVTTSDRVDTGTQAKAPTKAKLLQARGKKAFGSVRTSVQNYDYTHKRVADLEYTNRDPESIHQGLKVHFRDVIAEPEGAHSFATVWGTSFKTYSISKFWCYRLLTAILGIPFALFWGIYFAVLAFMNVWFIVPFTKAFVIQMKFVSKVWGIFVGTFLDPFFTSIGRVFSAIRVNLMMNRT